METEILRNIVAGVMKVDVKEIKPETTFIEDLGADSLDVMRILMEIEDRFNICVPKDIINDIRTFDDAVAVIRKTKKL